MLYNNKHFKCIIYPLYERVTHFPFDLHSKNHVEHKKDSLAVT